jgi:hypothetical protein
LVTDPKVPAPQADLAWQHLDGTVVPTAYRNLLGRYPTVINGRCLDVSKRVVCTHLVQRDDDWGGPVIVKTDLNFGGHAEDWLHRRGIFHHPWFQAVENALPLRLTARMKPGGYPVFANKHDVPGWMWNDRRLVMQRFLAERRDGRYAIRRWFVLGDRDFAYLAHGSGPIVQGDNNGAWTRVAHVPAALSAFRERIGLDCGKIDYAEVDGELVIYDVNPAVSADGPVGLDVQEQIVKELVPGFETFLKRAGL